MIIICVGLPASYLAGLCIAIDVIAIVQESKTMIQSDLVYPVLVYPDPSPSGRKSLVTDVAG